MKSLNAKVEALLQRLVESGEELGLQVAAYLGEELIVDAWAGVADERSGRAVDAQTLFTCWSVTKGFTTTCLHMLIDRGKIECDTPIAKVWPEFAVWGKHTVTLRHVLTHTAGVPQVPTSATPETIADWDAMSAAVASLAPLWAAGEQTGYHAWTYGWIAGEVLRRVDGRSIAQFAREELCEPLGISDFYLGLPAALEHRVARVQHEAASSAPAKPPTLRDVVLPSLITSAATINRPAVRQASLPATGGIMNARAIAKHYAMLANAGALNGVRILSPQQIDLARGCHGDRQDCVLDMRLRRGLGYCLGGTAEVFGDPRMGCGGGEFGHPGLGGSIGFADPERGLSFGLAKTLLKATQPNASAAYSIAELIRREL